MAMMDKAALAAAEHYYCHLDIQPEDIMVVCSHKQLFIWDNQELPATKSPSLQLICASQKQHVPITIIRIHWQNGFIVEKFAIRLFIEVMKKAFPQLSNHLCKICLPLCQAN